MGEHLELEYYYAKKSVGKLVWRMVCFVLIANALYFAVLFLAGVGIALFNLKSMLASANAFTELYTKLSGVFSDPLFLYPVNFLLQLAAALMIFGQPLRRSGVRLRDFFAPAQIGASGVLNALSVCLLVNFSITLVMQLLALLFRGTSGVEEFGQSSALPMGQSALQRIVFIVAVVGLAPFFEEVIFRGILLCPLRRFGDWFAILMSAMLFGLFHANLMQIPSAFGVGIVLGYLAVKYESILPGILVHSLQNLFAVLSQYQAEFADKSWLIIVEILGIAFFILGIVCLCRNAKKLRLNPGLPFPKRKKWALAFGTGAMVFYLCWSVLLVWVQL